MPSDRTIVQMPSKPAREICARALTEQGWEIQDASESHIFATKVGLVFGDSEARIDFKLLKSGVAIDITTDTGDTAFRELYLRIDELANELIHSFRELSPAEQESTLRAAFDGTAFISYAHEDLEFANRLDKYLTLASIRTLIDKDTLRIGVKWPNKLRRMIDESHALIIVISPMSLSSKWVRLEATHALKKKKLVLPVIHKKPEVFPKWFERQFGSIHHGDLTPRKYQRGAAELVDIIKKRASEVEAQSETT